MREHMGLFRGKRVDTGEQIEGFYHRVTDNWTHTNVHFITCFQDMPLTGETILTVQHRVDPDTVGECTGLRDKNGKLIFEGDIVEGCDFTVEDGGFGVVGFDDGAFTVSGNNIEGTFYENYWGLDFEVIGNIHDNPELLKGGEGE